jgi:methionyl-tRNA formyltransferase|tara:strand:- start:365 stop:1012 length:648 start_codon:yes stop_codon:yes gene_type:complete
MIDITILSSDKGHPVFRVLEKWSQNPGKDIKASLVNNINSIKAGGDILFLISCSEIVPLSVRSKFKDTLVIHASNLPFGRGWSPHIWQIINGADEITISLLEAEDKVDTGKIWKQVNVKLQGNELFDKINNVLFDEELKLIEWACKNYGNISPQAQQDTKATYYPKRTSQDSRIDIHESIESQFNLLRVCDPNRFPAFFIKDGKRYKLIIENYDE